MKSFCVECGEEGIVYEGLCQKCLPKRRTLVEIPSNIELELCVHCGAYKVPGGWRRFSLEDALHSTLSKAAKFPRDVQHHRLTIGPTHEDETKVRVHLTARLELDGMAVEEERDLEVRVKGSTCPQCSRKHGDYYEAIVQVRAEGRGLTRGELAAIRRLVEERVRADESLFVTREEEVHGGIDVYLGSNEGGRSIARTLKANLGGRLASSPRLHTRRKGKDEYRVTYRLRLSGLVQGDTVELGEGVYQVLSTGEPALLLDLVSGERRAVGYRELSQAARLEARRVKGTVISRTADELQVMDLEKYGVHSLPTPPNLDLKGDEVTLVVTKRGSFISPRETSEETSRRE